MPDPATRTPAADDVVFSVSDGMIDVSLRWPDPDAASCCCHPNRSSQVAEHPTDRSGPGAEPLFSGLISGVWWLQARSCRHRPCCGCGLVGVADAHRQLRCPQAREEVLRAVEAQLRDLIVHRDSLGSPDPLCGLCRSEPGAHLADLDELIASLGAEVAQVLATNPRLGLSLHSPPR